MVKRLLIIRLGAIGDVIMTTALLPKLREKYPEHKIYYLTDKLTTCLIEDNPYINEVLIFQETRRFIEYLKWLNFDVIINLQNRLSMTLIVEYLNPREVMGFYGGVDNNVYVTNKASKELLDMFSYGRGKHKKTFFEVYCDIVGVDKKNIKPFIKVEPKKKHKNIRIGIMPGSNWPAKRWGHENFSELTDRLYKKDSKYEVAIIGDTSDSIITNQIIKRCKIKKPKNLTGKYGLRELIHIINNLDVLVTHDTGPAFIATALDVPLVQIFGPTNPQWSGTKDSIKPKINCKGCFKYYCHHQSCMKEIKPEIVCEAIIKKLKGDKNR